MNFNFFDLVVVALLGIGVYRGRKNGMSSEMIPLVDALILVLVPAMAYETVAGYFYASKLFSHLGCNIAAYLCCALALMMLFGLIRWRLKQKLVGSDVFGKMEYYLGMLSGPLRFLCYLLVALSLLNARQYTTAEINGQRKFQMDNYGSEFFPTAFQLQVSIFRDSFSGRLIRENLSEVLLKPTEAETVQIHQKEAKWD